jgi:uncharacterized surface protein with fasciclin (FAS1) repeats
MKNITYSIAIATTFMVGGLSTGCETPIKKEEAAKEKVQEAKQDLKEVQAKADDIVTIASKSAKTLAAAVTAAGLVETLQGPGPFTVFAPTDAAFATIQKDVDKLLKPENKDKLVSLLKCHVVEGKVFAADLKDGQQLTTIDGHKMKVAVANGRVMVEGAVVTSPDLTASNGVIHVIDKVIVMKK